jgi:transcriptional regulator with XRE-family HTH domain
MVFVYNGLHMPAAAPPQGAQLKKILRHLGLQIRQRRKLLKISGVVTAEAAGISRMTLNRIERGEASVTIGAYINVISVLGLALDLRTPKARRKDSPFELPGRIRLADYPQLKKLAWQLKGTTQVTAEEALDLYERNWRHVDREKLSEQERLLIEALLAKLGRSKLLV